MRATGRLLKTGWLRAALIAARLEAPFRNVQWSLCSACRNNPQNRNKSPTARPAFDRWLCAAPTCPGAPRHPGKRGRTEDFKSGSRWHRLARHLTPPPPAFPETRQNRSRENPESFSSGPQYRAEEIAGERAHEPGDQIFHRANGRAARAEAQRRGEVEAVDVAQRRSLGSLIVKTDVSASGLSSTRRASVTRRRS